MAKKSTNQTTFKYTVVQHSGYGYAGNPLFQKGLESRGLEKSAWVNLVEKEGGLLFDTYADCEEYCIKEMYPQPDEQGLVPEAPGTFSDRLIDGLRIYLPPKTYTARCFGCDWGLTSDLEGVSAAAQMHIQVCNGTVRAFTDKGEELVFKRSR